MWFARYRIIWGYLLRTYRTITLDRLTIAEVALNGILSENNNGTKRGTLKHGSLDEG